MSRFDWISEIGPRLRRALIAVLLLLLVLLVFPFKTTIVPSWNLRVVDQSGTPVRGLNVTEHWQHYLIESSAHEDARQTGPDGRVSFPERSVRASLLRRSLATLVRLGKTGTEAKREPYASVVAWGSKFHETAVAVYDEEQPPQAEIVVHTTP